MADVEKLSYSRPVTIVGGGVLDPGMIAEATAFAPHVIAADGAADRLADLGIVPSAVIGDMDSVSSVETWSASTTKVLHLAEQDTTDFEKCLYSTDAPYFIAAGFTGRRIDHTLAVFHALLARPEKRVFLIGEQEVILLLRSGEQVAWRTTPGAVVSIFPLRPVRGMEARGLRWSIAGLDMAPGKTIGTSNQATEDRVLLRVDGDGALLIAERADLASLIGALVD